MGVLILIHQQQYHFYHNIYNILYMMSLKKSDIYITPLFNNQCSCKKEHHFHLTTCLHFHLRKSSNHRQVYPILAVPLKPLFYYVSISGSLKCRLIQRCTCLYCNLLSIIHLFMVVILNIKDTCSLFSYHCHSIIIHHCYLISKVLIPFNI